MGGDFSKFVTVTKVVSLTSVPAAGFGTMMILSGTPYSGAGTGWNTSELTRVYSDINAVGTDWGATTPEYRAAQAAFAGENPPQQVEIGKYGTAPALTYKIGLTAAINATKYSFTVNGQLVTFTSVDNVNDNIIAGLKSAFDLLGISGITSSTPGAGGSHVLQLAGSAGTYFYPSLYDTNGVNYGPGESSLNLLTMFATTAEPSPAMATQLANIRAERDDWYALVNPYPGLALNTAIAAYIQGKKKFFMAMEPSTDAATHVLSGATDLMAACKSSSYGDTMVVYHHKPVQFADSSWLGLELPTEPGTDNWAWGTLVGCDPSSLSSTHTANIEAKHGNYYWAPGGVDVTWQGTMADGTFADLKRWIDKLEARWQEAVVTALKNASPGKVPQDDRGIQIVYGALFGVLRHEAEIGAIESDFKLTAPKFADISASDKTNRLLSGFTADVTYSGATDTVSVKVLIQ